MWSSHGQHLESKEERGPSKTEEASILVIEMTGLTHFLRTRMSKYWVQHLTLFVNVNCFYFLEPSIRPDPYVHILGEGKGGRLGKWRERLRSALGPCGVEKGGREGCCKPIPNPNQFCWDRNLGPSVIRRQALRSLKMFKSFGGDAGLFTIYTMGFWGNFI